MAKEWSSPRFLFLVLGKEWCAYYGFSLLKSASGHYSLIHRAGSSFWNTENMASKLSTLCMVVIFLLFYTLSSVIARPEPMVLNDSAVSSQNGDKGENVEVEESCEGVGEEECLMRRTLAAQIDYIYTQKNKP
ncbi:Phytosulfokine [Dillenia turbinata]|uniref:Phytosulfokine n=1 Tax=Dillenia turbinata TaxID=194707 RepID=A0AAN8UIZ0_9MAGN